MTILVNTEVTLPSAGFHSDSSYPEVHVGESTEVKFQSNMEVTDPEKTTVVKMYTGREYIFTTPEALRNLVKQLDDHQKMVKAAAKTK